MVWETWVQSQIESYQRLKKWYLIPPCLTLINIMYVSRVKWSNPEKGVAPSPTPRCSSDWKGSLLVTNSRIYKCTQHRNKKIIICTKPELCCLNDIVISNILLSWRLCVSVSNWNYVTATITILSFSSHSTWFDYLLKSQLRTSFYIINTVGLIYINVMGLISIAK